MATFSLDVAIEPTYVDIIDIAAGYGIFSTPLDGLFDGDLVQTLTLVVSDAITGAVELSKSIDLLQRADGYFEWVTQSEIDGHFTLTAADITALDGGTWVYSCSAMIYRSSTTYTREYQAGSMAVRPTVPTPPMLVNSIVITGGPVSGVPGATDQLTATTYDGYGNVISGQPVMWASTNPTIATVSTTGLVTLVTPGAVTISATAQGLTATTTATCSIAPLAPNNGDVLFYVTADLAWEPFAPTAARIQPGTFSGTGSSVYTFPGPVGLGGGEYTWPVNEGVAGRVLTTDGAGVLTWGVPALALTDLSDVTIASVATGQFLQKSAGDWVNHTLVSADVSDATALNTASRIVLRDGSGSFAAGQITAATGLVVTSGGITVSSGTTAVQGFTATTATITTINGVNARFSVGPWVDITHPAYGADNTGAVDATAAINAALVVACASGLQCFAPAGTYKTSGGHTLTRAIRFFGEGPSTIFQVAAATGSTTDIFTISPASAAEADTTGYLMEGFSVVAASGTPGRHAIAINITTYQVRGSHISKVYLQALGGRGIAVLPHPTTPLVDGFYTSSIRDSYIRNGIYLDEAGDNITIDGNAIYGENVAIYAKMRRVSVSNTAMGLAITANNITSKGGALYVKNASQGCFNDNQVECTAMTSGSNNACIDLDGEAGAGNEITSFVIQNNKLSGTAGYDTVRLNRTRRCKVVQNYTIEVGGGGYSYRITANGTDNEFLWNTPGGDTAITSQYADAGTRTKVMQGGLSGNIEIKGNLALMGAYRFSATDTAGTVIPLLYVEAADNSVNVGATSALATNGHLLFWAQGVNVGRFQPGGELLIGTGSPTGGTTKLTVAGGIVSSSGTAAVQALTATSGAFSSGLTVSSGTTAVQAFTATSGAFSSGLTVSSGTSALQAVTGTTGAFTGAVTGATGAFTSTLTAAALLVSTTATTAQAILNANAGQLRSVVINTAASTRWVFGALGDAELGADAGSTWALYAYSDAGAFLGAPITVARAAAGAITLTRALIGTTVTANLTGNVTGNVTGAVTGNASTATALATSRTINGVGFDGTANITVTAAAGTLTGSAIAATVTSAAGLASATTTGTFTIGADAASGTTEYVANAAAGNIRGLLIATASLARWLVQGNATAELGADAGTDFRVTAFTDAGAAIDSPIQVARVAGGAITFARPVTASFGLTVSAGGLSVSSGTTAVQALTATTGAFSGNVTVASVTSGTWTATAIAALYGGTGLTSYAVGDTLYASATTPTIAKLTIGSAGQFLWVTGGLPGWHTLIASDVSDLATATVTFTNKRITKRAGTVASSATPTINTDTVDYYSITALAAAITSMTTNLSGTPTIGQTLWLAITDDGTARAITWGASFESSTAILPTTTIVSTRLDVGFVWNSVTSKWRCVAVA